MPADIELPRFVVEKKGYFYVRRVVREGGKRSEKYTPLPHPFDPGFQEAYERIVGEPGGSRGGTVSAMIEAYRESPEFLNLSASAQTGYRRALRKLDQAMGRFEIGSIQLKHIIAWRDQMAETPAEANHCVSRARTLWDWGILRDLASRNPAEKAPRLAEEQAGGPWSIEEVREAVCEMRPVIANAVALAFYTGMRKGDLLKLAPEHMRGTDATFRQQKTSKKTRVSTTVSMNEHAMEILQELWPSDGGAFLRNGEGNEWSDRGFSNAFADERARIGLPAHLRFHDLRHTAATIVAEEMPDLVPALLGHADARTSARYTREARQRRDARAAARVIPIVRSGKPET